MCEIYVDKHIENMQRQAGGQKSTKKTQKNDTGKQNTIISNFL